MLVYGMDEGPAPLIYIIVRMTIIKGNTSLVVNKWKLPLLQ